MKPFRTRLGRVHFRDGCDVQALHPKRDQNRVKIEKAVREALDSAPAAIAGYAIVVWDRDGSSSACMGAEDSCIPTILIPDFVRNRLLAYRIETWTREGLGYSAT